MRYKVRVTFGTLLNDGATRSCYASGKFHAVFCLGFGSDLWSHLTIGL